MKTNGKQRYRTEHVHRLDFFQAIRDPHKSSETREAKVLCERCGDRAFLIREGRRLCGVCAESEPQ